MDKKKQKLAEAMTEKTGKKVMKRDRTGRWVVALMFGLLMVGTAPVVGAEEQSQEQEVEIEEVAEQATVVSADPSDAIMWVANTPEQVATEIDSQSDEKDQDPLSDYTIVWGDTLWAISLATGTTVEELAENNNIENPDLIYAGDLLTLADGTVIRVGEEVAQGEEQESTQEVAETPQAEQESTQGQVAQTPQDEQDDASTHGSTVNDSNTTEQNDVEDEQDTGNFGAVDGDVDKHPDPVVDTPPVVDNGTDNEEQDSDEQDNGSDVGNGSDEQEDETPVEEEPEDEEPEDEEPEDETPVEEEPEDEEPEDEEPEIVEENPVEPEAPAVEEETEPEIEQEGNTGEDVDNLEPTETDIVPETDVPEVNETDPEVQEPQDPEEGEEQAPVITIAERTETYDIDYKLITRPNPELPVGEERVVQEGNFGKLTKTYKVTYRDGEEVNVEYVGETVTTAPVNTIIEYGTYVEPQPEISTSTRTVTEQIGYTEVIRENPNMYVGEEVVVQEGSYGEVVSKYKITYQDGEVVATDFISEEITKEPVNTIIDRGTKPVESTKTRTETEVVPFETETRNNSDMFEGETRVAQEGLNGERTITYEQTYIRGEFDSEKQVSSKITKQPVNKIVEVGTKKKPVITTETVTKTETIAFGEDREYSALLEGGDEKVLREGVNGEQEVVYEQVYEDGVLVETREISRVTTRQPINKRVQYGLEFTINNQLFAQEMLVLVNNLRESVGVSALKYDSTLQTGTDIRAQEIIGTFSHTRPDGRHLITAFGYEEPNYYLGENIASNFGQAPWVEDTSRTFESYMAERFFNQWKDSKGHYDNMVDEGYVTFATSTAKSGKIKFTSVQIFGTKSR